MRYSIGKLMLYVFVFGASCVSIVWFHYRFLVHPYAYYLQVDWLESDAFRRMEIEEGVLEQLEEAARECECTESELLTVLMVENGYVLKEKEVKKISKNWYQIQAAQMKKYNSEAWYQIQNAYKAILEDLCYFPIPESKNKKIVMPVFENSWGQERTYGGKRTHEGCDLMGMEYASGFYPIVSVSDGVIEQMGWLPQGGWRIGIRGEHGAYFYYAHLNEYALDLSVGQKIHAGQLLGYMGDTGYGTVEGTSGNFPVHLHFGMYICTSRSEEVSINPYAVLRYLQGSCLKWNY
ncbi:MAG: M23 family metallopeptidase [Lachnospiraceae bacterium]